MAALIPSASASGSGTMTLAGPSTNSNQTITIPDASVYWIHHPEHKNMFSDGYIGVSSNFEKRWDYHKKHGQNNHLRNAINKYGWDNLVKKQIIIAKMDYCLEIEQKLRPNDKIGWNIVAGGGKPPNTLGKKFIRSEKYKEKQRLSHLGLQTRGSGYKLTEEQKSKQFNLAEYMKDKVSPLKGKTPSPESIEKMKQTKLLKRRNK